VDSRQYSSTRVSLFAGLPSKVDLYEVGPRDGLQNEPRVVPTEEKLRLIEALVGAGHTRIEVTSFVSPKWIPQLADADELLKRLPRSQGVTFSALVPNLKGLARARDAGLQEAAIFFSASETHTKKNINRTIAEAVAEAAEIARAAARDSIRVRGYLSTVWGCPYEGQVSVDRVVELSRQIVDAGIYQVSLGDTIGVGTPEQTERILEAVLTYLKPSQIALHLHDTRGTALANALVGLTFGVTTLDASVGGLGGCPYAPGAAGNLATEDLVYMLQGLKIETGLAMDGLVEAGRLAQETVGRRLPGKYLQAALGEQERAARQKQK
jgi:hydroxymethylglutaryl-CoA lyase